MVFGRGPIRFTITGMTAPVETSSRRHSDLRRTGFPDIELVCKNHKEINELAWQTTGQGSCISSHKATFTRLL